MAFPAHALVVQAHMAVGFYAAGGDEAAFGVNDLRAGGGFDGGSDLGDLSVVTDENTAVFQFGSGHGFDVSVFNKKHGLHSFVSDGTSII